MTTHSGQVRSGQAHLSLIHVDDPFRSGQVRSGQVRSGQVHLSVIHVDDPFRSSQVRSGQVRSGRVRSSQVRSEPICQWFALTTHSETKPVTRDTKYTVLKKFAVGVPLLTQHRDFILRTAAHVNQAVFAVTRHGRVVVRPVSHVDDPIQGRSGQVKPICH